MVEYVFQNMDEHGKICFPKLGQLLRNIAEYVFRNMAEHAGTWHNMCPGTWQNMEENVFGSMAEHGGICVLEYGEYGRIRQN